MGVKTLINSEAQVKGSSQEELASMLKNANEVADTLKDKKFCKDK